MINEDTPYMQKNWLLRLYQDTVNVRTMRESNLLVVKRRMCFFMPSF